MDLIERLEARLEVAESVIERIDLLNELAFELRGKIQKKPGRWQKKPIGYRPKAFLPITPICEGRSIAKLHKLAIWQQMDNRMKPLRFGSERNVITQQRPDLLITRARIAISMATFYMRKGSYAEALRYLQEHLDVGQRIGDAALYAGLALAALGNLHGHIDEIDKAVHYSEARPGDPQRMCRLHARGGVSLQLCDSTHRCRACFWNAPIYSTMALERSRAHHYEVIESYALNSVGWRDFLNRHAEAVTYLRDGLTKDPSLMDEWLITASSPLLSTAVTVGWKWSGKSGACWIAVTSQRRGS